MGDSKMLYAASFCAATSLAALVLRWQRGGSRPPYPPGPRGYPLIGNVLDVPRDVPIWKGLSSIAQKYSKCLAPAGRDLTRNAFVLRHRCTVHEAIFEGLHSSEQLRGHLRPGREAVCHLLR